MDHRRPITHVGDMDRTPLKVSAFGLTDVGKVRSLNEDNLILRDRLCLWAVADGMGGHARGDFASETVVEYLGHVRPWAQPRPLLFDVVARLEDANTRLRDEAAAGGDEAIGATVVCLLFLDTQGLVVWAGDSRAYRLRRGTLEQLSRDHSVVEELVEAGLLDPSEAESHPHAHILTRAIGAADSLDLDFERFTLESGDIYLLCSDGLSRMVPDDEIAAILRSGGPMDTICERLVQTSLDRGAPDNVTVIAVRVD